MFTLYYYAAKFTTAVHPVLLVPGRYRRKRLAGHFRIIFQNFFIEPAKERSFFQRRPRSDETTRTKDAKWMSNKN